MWTTATWKIKRYKIFKFMWLNVTPTILIKTNPVIFLNNHKEIKNDVCRVYWSICFLLSIRICPSMKRQFLVNARGKSGYHILITELCEGWSEWETGNKKWGRKKEKYRDRHKEQDRRKLCTWERKSDSKKHKFGVNFFFSSSFVKF